MKKQLLYRAAAATVLGLSLTTGVAAADTGGYQNNNHHHNKGNNSLTANLSANVSNVAVNNETNQNAYSGNANVSGSSNNKGGDNYGDWNKHDNKNVSSNNTAKTGPAANANQTSGSVVVKQSPMTPVAAPSNKSDDHDMGGNKSVDVNAQLNASNVVINNETNQNAYSGNATVSGNNKGGSATTGKASNSNSSDFSVSVTQ